MSFFPPFNFRTTVQGGNTECHSDRSSHDDTRSEVNPARKRPEDVLPGFCNAEDSEKHLSSLTHFFDEDMDVTHDLAGSTLHRFEQTSGELEGLKREIRRASSTAEVVPTILKRMITAFPLQANQVLEEQSLQWEHGASTQAALDALTSRVDGFYTHLHTALKEVHRSIIQELGIRDYKKIFDQYVKKARAAAESATEFRKSMKHEVHDIRAQLEETRSAVEDERATVAKKKERIAILAAQLQGARSVAKDERVTVARQDELIATMTSQLKETRTAADNERATVARQDELIATMTAQLKETRTAADNERVTVARQDELIATMTAQLEETRSTVDNERATVARQDEQTKLLISQIDTLTSQHNDIQAALREECQRRADDVAKKDAKIYDLMVTLTDTMTSTTERVAQKNNDIKGLEARIKDVQIANETAVSQYLSKIAELELGKAGLEMSEQNVRSECSRKDSQLQQLQRDLDNCNEAHKQSIARSHDLEEQNTTLHSAATESNAQYVESLSAKDNKIKDLEDQNARLHLAATESKLQHVESLHTKDNRIKELEDQNTNLQSAATESKAQYVETFCAKDNQIKELEDQNTNLQSAAMELNAQHVESLCVKDSKIKELEDLHSAAIESKEQSIETLCAKDNRIKELQDLHSAAKAQHVETLCAKDSKIKELQDIITTTRQQAATTTTQLEGKMVALQGLLQTKSDELASKLEVIGTRGREIATLEQEMGDVRATSAKTQQSLVTLTADHQVVVHAMVSFAAGVYIRPDQVDHTYTDMIAQYFSGGEVRIEKRLPTLSIAKFSISVFPAIRLWATIKIADETSALEQIQTLFDIIPHRPIHIRWFASAIRSIVRHLQTSTSAKLCLAAMQGLAILRASAVDFKHTKTLHGIGSLIKKSPSGCLRHIMGELDAYCANGPHNNLQWLSGYKASYPNHLDSTNSALPTGSNLVSDESELFFLFDGGSMSVFVVEDVKEVVWDIPDNHTLTMLFQPSCVIRDSLVLSRAVLYGPAFELVVKHMSSKYRVVYPVDLDYP